MKNASLRLWKNDDAEILKCRLSTTPPPTEVLLLNASELLLLTPKWF
jgi:hypothetical protein